ncbi:MAG: hypothetical protein AseanaTS_08810 [Candidatus Pelagadaptatus aseana]|uniref:DcaP family trimeric outer membrane transporter n=1 Tax=Candidatus Pelagadaptatus aseana TaxID=3120508 RepID=UPI0039B13017
MKKPLVAAVAACALGAAALPAVAADDAVLKRMEMLEQELKALKESLQKKEEVQLKKGVELKKGTRFQYGGYIKMDMTSTDTTEIPHYFHPNSIGIEDEASGEREFGTSAKQSRFWLKGNHETSAGDIVSYIEMDFTGGDDQERLTNNNASRLRHAFLKWNYSEDSSLLAGQFWSTFMNTGAYPETLDWVGPTSGIVFIRQQQLRWTTKMGGGSFMLAAENPFSYVDGDLDDTTDTPDLVVR